MLLLVIGLVALIIAVLVGLFLTRRRRDDDDETRQTGGKPSGTGPAAGAATAVCALTRGRPASPPGRGPAPTRRPAGEPRGYGGPDRGYEPAGFDQSRGYEPSPRGYGDAPRSRDDQRTERIPAARRGGSYQDAPEPATPVGARASRAAAPRRGAVGTDTGPGNALYDTGPSAADLTATRVTADPDLADSDVFPRVRAEIPETEAKPRRRARPRDAGGPRAAGTTTMTTTGPARSGTSSPTSSTGRNCPPTSRSRPRPAAPSPALPPRRPRLPDHGPPPRLRCPGAPDPGRTRRRTPAQRARAAASLPTVPGGRACLRARPGEPTARTPTLGVLSRSSGPRLRRPRSGCRPAAGLPEPAPPVPAPYLPAAPEPVQDRADDDPLTSPHFARGAGGPDDSRSYRTPRRNPGPRPDRSGGQAYPGTPNGYPGAPEAYPAGYPASSGGYPATGQNPTGPLTNPGGPARSSGPARGRDSYACQARDSLAGDGNGDRRYADSSGGYESYPAAPDGGRSYPASSGRHGYPAGQAERTDPGASRPDLGVPRTDPGSPRTDPGPRTSPGRAAQHRRPPGPGQPGRFGTGLGQ